MLQLNQPQSEEQRESNPASAFLSSGIDAYEHRSLEMVENSMSRACSSVDNYGSPNLSPFYIGFETIITDAKKKFKKTNETIRTQSNVKDVTSKKENDELKVNGACLEIDQVEKSDNSVLRKLLRGLRYFDPPDSIEANCYNCGEGGHTITNCTAANRKKPCFLCGSLEHNAKQCKQRKGCFYCKRSGHYAKDCPEKSIEGFGKAKICLKCGDSGHEIYTCKTVLYSADDLKEIQCYICKCVGHLCCVDYGEGPSEVSCYRCGQLGHAGLKCKTVSSRAIAHAEASPSCYYKCGQEGHKARKCRTSAKKRKRKNAKQSNIQDNIDDVGVRSAPRELGKACKRNRTQHGYATRSQRKRRGGWVDEDPGGCFGGTQSGSLSTPTSYRPDKDFHGDHASSDFQYED